MAFKTTEEILDFAINEERKAQAFYKELAAKMAKPHMEQIFLDFAKEEKGHENKLLKVKQGDFNLPTAQKVQDLKIGDNLADAKLDANMDFQDALIEAMKAEKNAFALYTELAEAAEDENFKAIFKGLAQEEAKHKLRFEIEYDDVIYKEN